MADTTYNQRYSLPDDQAEATRVVWEKLKKLAAERAHIAARYRDVLYDAKADGYPPSLVRLGNRLDDMTPEKREKWIEDARRAAALFGFDGLEHSGSDDIQDKALWGYVQKGRFLRREKRELMQALRDLRETAAGREVDFAALQHMLRFNRLDPEDREEWMHRIDKMATFLGFW